MVGCGEVATAGSEFAGRGYAGNMSAALTGGEGAGGVIADEPATGARP